MIPEGKPRKDMLDDETIALYGFLLENTPHGKLRCSTIEDAVSQFKVSRSTVSRVLKKVRNTDDHLGAVESLKRSIKEELVVKQLTPKIYKKLFEKHLCHIEVHLDLLKKLPVFQSLLCTWRCIEGTYEVKAGE